MVLWTAVSVGGTTSLVQTEISQQLVEGKFTDIYGPQRMNFGDLLTFPLVLWCGWNFCFFIFMKFRTDCFQIWVAILCVWVRYLNKLDRLPWHLQTGWFALTLVIGIFLSRNLHKANLKKHLILSCTLCEVLISMLTHLTKMLNTISNIHLANQCA